MDAGISSHVSVERQSGISVGGEDLTDGINVGRGPNVQPEIHHDGSVHHIPGCPLHRVVQARVHNVLFRGSRHSLLELITR